MKLSRETEQMISATVPLLERYGVDITTVFYERMFEAHPELLHIFNETNQLKGRQQTALAQMVCAAAQHIDRLEEVSKEMMLVAHKHRSLTVQPEHYPIVGHFLLLAIEEVLGERATPSVLQAWKEAYNVIADHFIAAERQLYEAAPWKNFKPFIVQRKVVESETVTSFYLVPEDGEKLPTYEAGQYVTIRLNTGDPYVANRQYTISCAPNGQYFRISVKREPNGRVSNYLHDNVNVGDRLDVTAPAGEFVYVPNEAGVTFISAGVGITPMMAMLEVAKEVPIQWIHSSKSKAVQPFSSTLSDIEGLTIYTEEGDERLSAHMLRPFINEGAYYICGPRSFMDDVTHMLRNYGIEEHLIYSEQFGPFVR